MPASRHHFRGRPDRWCEDCHRPDRDPIHYTQVELDRGIDTDDLERGDADDDPGVAEQRGSGAHVTGPAVATPTTTAGPARCVCGHGLAAHTGTGVAGHACTHCLPPRHCAGWLPAGPPDLDQAIQAATNALAGQLFGTPEQLARYARIAVEAAVVTLRMQQQGRPA